MSKMHLKSLLLSGVMALSLLGGIACDGDNDIQNTDQPKKVLMNGFELFDRDIQLIRVFNEFGRLDENKDKQFVRSGESSLKITPLGSRVSTANPFFLLPTFSLRFPEVAFGDFSKVDSISFWFYNNEEENVNVGVGFGAGVLTESTTDRRDYINKTNVEYFSLSHGWNYIEYTVEPAYLALQGLNIKEVYGVVLEFDYVQSHQLADSPEVYLDDVYLSYLGQEKTNALEIEVEKGTTAEGNAYWQISDFENPLEAYYYYYHYKYPAPASAHPVMKAVYAGDYDAITTKGTQALLIQKKHGGNKYGWPTVRIHEKVMKAVFAEIGEDIRKNPQNYALKFDVYNASDVVGGWSVEYDNAQTWSSISVQPKQWATYSYDFGKVNAAVTKKKDAEGNPTDEYNEVYTEIVGNIRFSWSKYNEEENREDRPFLLDNVRIEKIA